jgi:hypothetical protein
VKTKSLIRTLILLWCCALLWAQMSEITELRHSESFWVNAAYEFAGRAQWGCK